MIDDDDLESDVARLRAKWFGKGSTPPKALDAEEEAVAAKWLGRSEAARLARTRSGERFRPQRPAVVVAHYGYIPPAESPLSAVPLGDYWYLEVFKLGKKYTLYKGGRAGCLDAVSRLQRMRINVTRVGSERAPEELSPPAAALPSRQRRPSQRKAILEQLKGWR